MDDREGEWLVMNYEKEVYIGPVEQEINSMMGTAGNEIMDHTQKGAGTKEGEIVQNIHIVNLSRCIIYLAKEIDKLAKSIK
jgi:hypothetical protein